MNKFDLKFFSKYVPEGQEIKAVIHTHPINVLMSLFVKLCFLVIFPVILYYYSWRIQELVPFMYLEIYLLLVYIKLVYDVFDWYNDVWIITDSSVIWLERSFLKSSSDSVNYDNIEWVWVEADWIWDKIFSKWNLMVHKVWDDSFVLANAINPYKAVDLIEETSAQNWTDDEKFDVIMDALSWVVWEYLHDNKKKVKEKEIKESLVEKIKEKEWTIDLR